MLKKSLELLRQEAAETGTHTLKRSLSAFNLVAIGVGVIIGAGLFSLTGIAAANHTGPAVTLSFLVAAVGCAFSALCYAEFASMVPVAGSAYTYSYATLGELFAWIIGWDLVLEYSVGAAAVAISWSQYLTRFLAKYDLHIPAQLVMSPFETATLADGSLVHGIVNLPAILIVVAITAVVIRGTQGSAWVNATIVALKVSVVLVFIALGWQYIDPANYQPYIPANTGTFGEFGLSGILRGAGVIFFVFIGFDIVATMAQEAKNPQRDMPIGIIGSLVVCTVLFVLFGHVMTGLANYTEFKNSAAPVAIAIEKTPYAWLSQAIIVAILIGYTSVILVDLLGQSRVFFSMSRDGLLPKIFSEVHPRFRTPVKSNILLAALISAFAGLVPIQVVGEMTSIGTLLAFVMVCLGVLIMRRQQPDAPRAFRTPWVPLVPILGILTCLVMMFSLPFDTWLRLIVWLAAGLVIYFLYGKKHSKLRIAREQANRKV
ncbi:amino acid/polyamine/organocation transporter, APC superfamily (TC 2.A.3) [Hymenobacter roseosalivarius DSM 11622]|uniref:Amino acid/polyamine/organocation transporter, APC superfamily (TC 2.A.3) n=1 Tax=Hymenobacter roseosalivarius DSM 11622 TaxID=645990 RepID=A0A1W1W4D5_9BACT|nr:amino acid permease [Hymenobacter roseosalivarius]SMC00456.1 amino acid/polyamine/organocation transporter, APC superfamily (TC 2.A.3) [Hymenobacter roseosalivarius DSM 11622]